MRNNDNSIISKTQEDISNWIAEIEALPTQIREAVDGLSDEQLDTPYRPNGWTLRQVVHHLPDSHMNSYIRTKRILAEDRPEQRPFSQENWVDMVDETNTSVETSLMILQGIHIRWVLLFENLMEDDWGKTGLFRSDGTEMTIDYLLNSYANHSTNHLAQIEKTINAL